MMEIGPGSLKLVSAWSPRHSVRERVAAVLQRHIRAEDIRYLHGRVFLLYTAAEPATIRDWLAPYLEDDESVFVVEFERWSGYGPSPDRDWLRRRGH